MQCDADTVGTDNVAADAEACMLMADVIAALGLPSDQFKIKLNNRKVLDGLLEIAGIDPASEADAQRRLTVLRAMDKFDKFGIDGVRYRLGKGRKDESGDFTKGAGLSEVQADKIMQFVRANDAINQNLRSQANVAAALGSDITHTLSNAYDSGFAAMFGRSTESAFARNAAAVAHLKEIVGESLIGAEGVDELGAIVELLSAQGYGPDRIVIDPGVVRGLGYYTGPVYEAELTFEILDEKGRKRQFGSVAGGGRYDGLVKRFTGQDVPATGVSIGVDRLLAALQAKGRMQGETAGPVVVTVMDRDRMADYMGMVGESRQAGIRSEVYLGNPKNFGNQLKYADKRQSPVAVIQGGNEATAGTVILKDLILGAKIAESATLEEWKDRPAQVEVPRAELVAAVRKMLGQ
jgi:histidyl-tRNA synthetase